MTTVLTSDYTRDAARNTPRTRLEKAAPEPREGERWTVGLYLAEVKGQWLYAAGGGVG